MAIHYRTEGFILKKNDLREADQIFTVFTKDFGKIKILARAIRKIKSKLRSGADLFYLSELEFIQGKAYKTLTDANVLSKFEKIRKNLEKLEIVQQIADALNSLVHEEEQDNEIWDLLNEVLDKLKIENSLKSNPPGSPLHVQKNCKLEIVYYYFLWNLFSILGYQIDLYNCVACQKKLSPSKLYFSPDQGGIVCLNCSDRAEQKIPARNATHIVAGGEISPNAIKILRILLKKDWDTLLRLKIQDSEKKDLESISELNLRNLARLAG